jgi:tripartite-type tricarboxylate transporter receptor subunit TctC
MRRRSILKLALAATAALALPFNAAAAEYPSKPITIVAPYGPGGSADLAARALASTAPSHLGQPIMVVNRTGAGGVTGSTFVSQSRSDGYTLLLSRVGSNGVTPALNASIPYKYDDFTFLGLLELNPYVFVVRADSPHKTLDDLVAALKADPGKLSYSTSGPGTILNMGPQMLFQLAGLKSNAATMIPYKGGGGARTALVGGHVDFLGINLAPVLDNIRSGQLRALAVTTENRYAAIPEVPTVAEVGYPQLQAVIGWSGLWGPPDLPQEVVAKWTQALAAIKNDKAWQKLTTSLGSEPHILSPEQTAEFVRTQYQTYHKLGRDLNLAVE